MPPRTGFALSVLEYDLIWHDLGLGALRYPLEVPSHGLTMEERAELRDDATAGLTDRGLLRDGLVDGELEDALHVLSAPWTTVDLVGFADGPLRAVVAVGERGAVLGKLTDRGLTVRPIRDTALVSSIVALLPDMPPGEGQSMSVPLDAMRKAAAEPDPDDFGDDPFGNEMELTETEALVKLGVSRADAVALTELADSRIGGGQFGVSVAGRGGSRMRRAGVVTWFDTPRGRYLMFSDGDWVSVAPAGPDRIAWRIEESLRGLSAA